MLTTRAHGDEVIVSELFIMFKDEILFTGKFCDGFVKVSSHKQRTTNHQVNEMLNTVKNIQLMRH